VLLGQLERFYTVRGFKHRVSVGPEDLPNQTANCSVVVGKQDCQTAGFSGSAAHWIRRIRVVPFDHRDSTSFKPSRPVKEGAFGSYHAEATTV
jgi:hypothetical protein